MFWNKKNKSQNVEKGPELVLLKTANNDYELDITKGILDDNKILYIVNHTAAGGYMKIRTGVMLESADILVDKNDYNKAKELIAGVFEPIEDDDSESQ